jgi:CheY-like chemotaxis protein
MSISLKPLNVWLVDDDASIRWVLERALRQGGMSPTAFDQADSALAALRRDRPDVLITDIRMPGRSGLELLTQIRASQPELPVIVMTAHIRAALSNICRSRSTSTRRWISCGARLSNATLRRSQRSKRGAFPRCSVRRRRCRKSSARSAGCRVRA